MRYCVLLFALAAPLLIAEEKKAVDEKGVTEAIRKKLARKVTLELKDQPIDEAFGHLRSITMVGMVMDPRVNGKGMAETRITYACKDKLYPDVLDDLCRLAGLKWEIRGKVFITAEK